LKLTEIHRGLPRCSCACVVLTFIIHVRHSQTKLPLWECGGMRRRSRECVVVVIFIINVHPSHTKCPLWGASGCGGAPVCAWCLFSASLGCSWLLLAVPGCSWFLLAAPGCFWLLLASPGSGASGCLCVFMASLHAIDGDSRSHENKLFGVLRWYRIGKCLVICEDILRTGPPPK
jgi:hypothetical protein